MNQPPPEQPPGTRPSGSAAERRSGLDRRSRQRRRAGQRVSAERRAGGERRYWEDRRGRGRRSSLDAAIGTLARERARARRLLDEFPRMQGPVDQRVAKLVRRQWPAYPLGARAFLAQRLTALLSTRPEQAGLTEEVRKEVEQIVADWAGSL